MLMRTGILPEADLLSYRFNIVTDQALNAWDQKGKYGLGLGI